MSPKLKVTRESKPLIGCVGTSLNIVGLPTVGKSTFCNLLTKSAAQLFTIDLNENKCSYSDYEQNYWLLSH
ncbi:hypothetical protein OUZ56_006885 [Daphnia magna]|uniref:OBG-type G domain-containing protein n=1 Tax=Daphnia magna TaxID=35525 RepID=A0ABQ9YWZ4_9CRUS|nr:hypothetical protein OUZ56_006885 [Daphnia magna]